MQEMVTIDPDIIAHVQTFGICVKEYIEKYYIRKERSSRSHFYDTLVRALYRTIGRRLEHRLCHREDIATENKILGAKRNEP